MHNPTIQLRREIRNALRDALGPVPGLAVIHSSLPDLGPPRQLTRWDVLYALDDAVRAGWTLALPAFTFNFCSGAAYEAARTPSAVGVLADWVRESIPAAQRTRCPIYSFVVVGPQAEQLVALQAETVWGRGSLFELAEEQNARIVMLGCSWKSCTQFHRYEEIAAVPYRYHKNFTGQADFGDGMKETVARMYVRDLDLQPRNDFNTAITRLRDRGLFHAAPLWRGAIESIPANALAENLRALMKENPFALVAESAALAHRLSARRRAAEQPPVRVAVLGHATMELLAKSLKEQFQSLGVDRRIDVLTVPFGQLQQELIAPDSVLHRFKADVSIFCDRLEDLFGEAWADQEQESLLGRMDALSGLIRKYHETCGGWSLLHTFARLSRSPDAQRNARLAAFVEVLNARFRSAFDGISRAVWLETAQEIALAGVSAQDDRLWRVGRFPFGDAFSRHLAARWCAYLLAILGKSARLLVFDLDNTMWGGVLGEDGIEGVQLGGDYPGNVFRALQNAIRGLAQQGIALAVCSKNDEKLALEAIDRLPNMCIRSRDLAAYRINWESKSANIRAICAELNLGAESVLFIDDNPVEREEVRRNLPGVRVLDLPDDPAGYSGALLNAPWVVAVERTQEDAARLKNYQARRQIEQERGQAENIEDFLRKLGMKVYMQPFDELNAARAAQLCQKTNQFNTTTRRYTQRELAAIVEEGGEVIVVGLEDKHTERENIGVMVLRSYPEQPGMGLIDLYLLSCRVLGRGLETALPGWACLHFAARGKRGVIAPIIPTDRNQPVREVYSKAGFTPMEGGLWTRDLSGEIALPDWIAWMDSTPSKGAQA